MTPEGRRRIAIVCGHYGAGKSECAIALALAMARPTALVDLDVVNPYFRSREARASLEEHGVSVIGNSLGIDAGIDLPAVSGSLVPLLRDHEYHVVVDLGGDPAGARALRQFRSHIPPDDTDLLYVANAYRPETRDPASVVRSVEGIQDEISMKCTGIISNAHLLAETTCEHVAHGVAVAEEAAATLGVPVAYTAATEATLDRCRERATRIAGAPLVLTGALRESWMNARR